MQNLIFEKLAFEPVQVCNAACTMCPYTVLSKVDGYTKQKMEFDRVEDILQQFSAYLVRHGKIGKVNPFRYSDPVLYPDLERILELSSADLRNLTFNIVTNGEKLSGRVVEALKKNIGVINKISISMIGYDEKSVKRNMGIDFSTVYENLVRCADTELVKSMIISLRFVDDDYDETVGIRNLANDFRSRGFKVVVEKEWISNRLDVFGFSDNLKGNVIKPFPVNCSKQAIFSTVEIDVRGNVLMCCDDSLGFLKHGNVFRDGLESCLFNLRQSFDLLLEKNASLTEKAVLPCVRCSRAVF